MSDAEYYQSLSTSQLREALRAQSGLAEKSDQAGIPLAAEQAREQVGLINAELASRAS